MQVERLPPSWVHKEMDRAVRKCVWGSVTEHQSVHLLRGETLLKSKKAGGFNLKFAKYMNWALLAKLA